MSDQFPEPLKVNEKQVNNKTTDNIFTMYEWLYNVL